MREILPVNNGWSLGDTGNHPGDEITQLQMPCAPDVTGDHFFHAPVLIKTLFVPSDYADKRVFLRCHGIECETEVYVGGQKVASSAGEPVFLAEITPAVVFGAENTLELVCHPASGVLRVRGFSLVYTESTDFSESPVFSLKRGEKGVPLLHIDLPVSSLDEGKYRCAMTVCSSRGSILKKWSGQIRFDGKKDAHFIREMSLTCEKMKDLTLTAELYAGDRLISERTFPVNVWPFEKRGKCLLLFGGRRVFRGIRDVPAHLSRATPDELFDVESRALGEIRADSVMLPADVHILPRLERCARDGRSVILTLDPGDFTERDQARVTSTVAALRGEKSICMFCFSPLPSGTAFLPRLNRCIEVIRELTPTCLIAGEIGSETDLTVGRCFDVLMLSSGFLRLADFRKMYPAKPMILCTRKESDFLPAWQKTVAEEDGICGHFADTDIPERRQLSVESGAIWLLLHERRIVDRMRVVTPGDRPCVWFQDLGKGPEGTYSGLLGSDCPEVSFLVDGRPIGKFEMKGPFRTFSLPSDYTYAEAVGFSAGGVAARFVHERPAEPYALSLSCRLAEGGIAGFSLGWIICTAIDSEGHETPSNKTVTISVEGDAYLDLLPFRRDQGISLTLRRGRAVIPFRVAAVPTSHVRFFASSESLMSASLEVGDAETDYLFPDGLN